ncbi:hypothetical protein RCH21_001808 [Arthrobacter sp. PL16]|nr:hypothetical protein [Arthrobacter sp. PL16]
MSQIVLGNAAPPRLCPTSLRPPFAAPSACSHCAGKYCIQTRPGLLVLWWAPGSLLDLADVMAAYAVIRDVSEGYLLPLVTHLQGMVGIAADARSVILDSFLSSRVAFVGKGPVDQVIAAFLDQALSETRYFESPVAAEAWARDKAVDDHRPAVPRLPTY